MTVGMSYITGECLIDIYQLKCDVWKSHILRVNYVGVVTNIFGGTWSIACWFKRIEQYSLSIQMFESWTFQLIFILKVTLLLKQWSSVAQHMKLKMRKKFELFETTYSTVSIDYFVTKRITKIILFVWFWRINHDEGACIMTETSWPVSIPKWSVLDRL